MLSKNARIETPKLIVNALNKMFPGNKCIQETLQGGCISMFYKYFVSPSSKLPYQIASERDLGIAPELEDWRTWTTCIHKGIMNVALIEAGYKVLTRWYLWVLGEPERLSKKYQDSSPSCFRDCGRLCSSQMVNLPQGLAFLDTSLFPNLLSHLG